MKKKKTQKILDQFILIFSFKTNQDFSIRNWKYSTVCSVWKIIYLSADIFHEYYCSQI